MPIDQTAGAAGCVVTIAGDDGGLTLLDQAIIPQPKGVCRRRSNLQTGQVTIGATMCDRHHVLLDHEPRLIRMPGDGGAEQVIAAAAMSPSDWSPDGTTLLGTCKSPVTHLFTVCLLALRNGDTSSPRVVAADPLRHRFAQRISPDQNWISFITVKGPISAIDVARPDGGPWVWVSDSPSWDDKVRWAPDSRALYWVSDRTGRFNVWGRRFDSVAGKPVGVAFPVTSLDNPQQGLPTSIRGLEIALTTDRLIAPIVEAAGGVWIIDHPDR